MVEGHQERGTEVSWMSEGDYPLAAHEAIEEHGLVWYFPVPRKDLSVGS